MNQNPTSHPAARASRRPSTLAALVLVAATSATLALAPARAHAQNAVTTWDAAVEAAASAGRPPPGAEYLHTLVHLAIWDAVVSIEGGHAPYLATIPVPGPASLDAAVAAAAYEVARVRIPAQEPALTAVYVAHLATLPDGEEKENGLAVGLAAAEQLLAARAGDGFDVAVPWVQPAPGPGVFEPVAPGAPADVKLMAVAPLLPRAIDGYRPRGPAPLGSRRYAAELHEVQVYGRMDGGPRTPEQTEVARFWSENTFRQYTRSLRELAVTRGLDTFETSRFLAKVHLAVADAVLAGFEAKYHFLAWRPVHAIQRAQDDGNRHTQGDPSWTPLLVVNHPEYPSGHAFWTGALAQAVAGFFGTLEVPWTISSAVTQTSRSFTSLRDLRDEVADARVWGGLHLRRSMEDGDRLGRRVARLAAKQLRPIEDDEQEREDEDDED